MERLREIAGPVGALEARLDVPTGEVRAMAVIAHPHTQYGGTMQTRAVHETAKALARVGVVALRFNFRGAGASAGAFDEGRGEQDDYRAVLDAAQRYFPNLPIWAIGMSFGAWVATTVGATDPRVTTLVAIAPAVSHYDFVGLRTSGKPVFIVHGELDEVAPVRLVRTLYGEIPEPKDLVVIEGANHVFDGMTASLAEAIEDLLGDSDDTKSTKDGGGDHLSLIKN